MHWSTVLPVAAAILLTFPGSSSGMFSSNIGPVLPPPRVSAIPANVVFPAGNLSLDSHLDDLASFLVLALGLAPANETFRNGLYFYMCCLYDMNGHMMAMENGSSAVVEFEGHVGMNVQYSSTGRFMELDLIGSFGTRLPSSDWAPMTQRVRDLANNLGLAAFPLSFQGSNVTGSASTAPETTVAAFSDPYSLPVALGNQLIVTFDTNRGIAVGLQLFPWFSSPPPAISSAPATSAALAYLNETVVPANAALTNGSSVLAFSTYLGLDFIRYALVYHVEAMYTAPSHNPPGYPSTVSFDYRVWVDAGTGTVVYWVWVLHRGPPPDYPPPWILWVGVGTVIIVLATVALTLRRRRSSPPATAPREPPPGPHS